MWLSETRGIESFPANFAYARKPFLHYLQRLGVVVHQDEAAAEFVGRHAGCAAPREEIQYHVTGP